MRSGKKLAEWISKDGLTKAVKRYNRVNEAAALVQLPNVLIQEFGQYLSSNEQLRLLITCKALINKPKSKEFSIFKDFAIALREEVSNQGFFSHRYDDADFVIPPGCLKIALSIEMLSVSATIVLASLAGTNIISSSNALFLTAIILLGSLDLTLLGLCCPDINEIRKGITKTSERFYASYFFGEYTDSQDISSELIYAARDVNRHLGTLSLPFDYKRPTPKELLIRIHDYLGKPPSAFCHKSFFNASRKQPSQDVIIEIHEEKSSVANTNVG